MLDAVTSPHRRPQPGQLALFLTVSYTGVLCKILSDKRICYQTKDIWKTTAKGKPVFFKQRRTQRPREVKSLAPGSPALLLSSRQISVLSPGLGAGARLRGELRSPPGSPSRSVVQAGSARGWPVCMKITVSEAGSLNLVRPHLFLGRGALTEHNLIHKLPSSRCV